MTFEASRLTVLATTAPQPSWKALAVTFRLVPGGPEAMINGLGSLSPLTLIDRVDILLSLLCRKAKARCSGGSAEISSWMATKDSSSPGTECDIVPQAFAKSGGSSLLTLRAMAAFPKPMLNPKRTVAELKELRALTEDEDGAQRV